MSETPYVCPKCRFALMPVHVGRLDTWECKEGHGIAISLSESYGHLQEDEISAIWRAAGSGKATGLKSPLLGKPMIAIEVLVDDDEGDHEGQNARMVALSVAPEEQFLWFAVADFKSMPADLPNPGASDSERAAQHQLAEQSRQAVARDLDSREDDLDRLATRFGTRVAALTAADRVMRWLGGGKAVRELPR